MENFAILLIFLILFSGCLEKREVKYVCSDNSVVSNPKNCPELEKSAPEKITVTKYVCPGGEVVNKTNECELPTSSTLTTTTLLETTTLLKTTSTTTSSTITIFTIPISTTVSSPVIITQNIEISATQFDAPGDDRKNLNGEWVEIKNNGDVDVDMNSWTLEDGQNHVYTFPIGFMLIKGNLVKVHTGKGQDTSSDLYWGSGRAIWNNDGDTATLKNRDRKIVDQKSE